MNETVKKDISTESDTNIDNIDLNRIKPYGDTHNDGKVQLGFTLPLPPSPESMEAARQLASKMGLEEVTVADMKDLSSGFSFYVVYGKCRHSVDFSRIKVAKVDTVTMDFYQINDYIKENIGRPLVVIGACTGTDAHTVGLDAIMNMKGFAGEYGLERYPMFKAVNMGSQVANEELIGKALEENADALLVSQVVTQKDSHIKNLTHLVELLEAENLKERFVTVIGGPRISHELALELGFDAGFGSGCYPYDVAGFLAQTIAKRSGSKQ